MRTLLVLMAVSAGLAAAQDNPFSNFNKEAYGQMKSWLLASAEKMPPEHYGFKPVDTVRSFGQLLGHVADSQYWICSAVLGEKNPSPKVEQTKTTKAEIIAALQEAFTYCDKAYATVSDASAGETVKLFGGDMPKPVALTVNAMHDAEHYGNVSTYLRMKNIVPPSSERPAEAKPKK